MAHGDHLKDNAKPKEGRKTFCRLISYLSCDRRLLFVIGFLIIVSIIANLLGSYMLPAHHQRLYHSGRFPRIDTDIDYAGCRVSDRGRSRVYPIYITEQDRPANRSPGCVPTFLRKTETPAGQVFRYPSAWRPDEPLYE